MPATEKEENLISHLEALRSVLIKSLLALAAGFFALFFITPQIIDFLIKTVLNGAEIKLNFFSPVEVFLLQIKTALALDILLCFPYLAWQFWGFILPALYDNERKFLGRMVFVCAGLFIAGSLFCLFFIAPLIVRFGLSFTTEQIQPVLGISNILSLVLWLSLAFGAVFQLPLITYGFIKAGILNYNYIKSKRPYVIVGLLIVAGLLTPPDIISQVLLALPAYLLFEAGLFLAKPSKKDKTA